MAEKDENNILLEEYKALWNYYTCQIKILSGFRELYIKIFLVPTSVLFTAALAFSKSITEITSITTEIIFGAMAILLVIAFLMGLALFVSYFMELGNMGNYEQAMIDIRRHLWEYNRLESVKTIDSYRQAAPIATEKNKKKRFYRSQLFSLGLIFMVGNSFLLASTAVSFFTLMEWLDVTSRLLIFAGLCIISFALQCWWSYHLYYHYTGAGAAELSKAAQ